MSDTCPTCQGSGHKTEWPGIGGAKVFRWVPCPDCQPNHDYDKHLPAENPTDKLLHNQPPETLGNEGAERETPWLPGSQAEGRMSPRECVAAARDSLNKAYGIVPAPYPLLIEALDWMRRALEQMASAHIDLPRTISVERIDEHRMLGDADPTRGFPRTVSAAEWIEARKEAHAAGIAEGRKQALAEVDEAAEASWRSGDLPHPFQIAGAVEWYSPDDTHPTFTAALLTDKEPDQ